MTAQQARGAGELRLFPGAAQPSVIRAHQKDELYLQHLTDACHDTVRRLLGPRAAMLWARETQLAAHLLYHALTTGSGLQTLGEEYCDVLQAHGAAGIAPGPARRGALVLLQALSPYLTERLTAPADEGFAAWQAAREPRQQPQAGQPTALRALLQRITDAARAVRAHGERALQPLQQRFPGGAAFLRENSGTLLRLHLALFYITGMYYQLSKRATGVRYLFMGRAAEGRPSYRLLGLVLLAQLGGSAALWALHSYGGAAPLRAAFAPASGTQQLQQGGKPRHAALLREDGSEVASSSSSDGSQVGGRSGATRPAEAGSGEVPSTRKCPLCLSERDHPTSTPCGHLFCWQCIAEWCTQKPECPLCRAEVSPSSLVPVNHSDY